MLVTCPECGARYEIDGTLIPPEGRRVQCSSCDHVWQQARPDDDRAIATPPADEEETPRERPPLAEDVKAILREEAERESRLRRERGVASVRSEPAPAAAAVPDDKPRARTGSGSAPDAEAVDATLRAASERAAEAHGRGRGPAQGGFAAGLVVGLVLVGLAAAIYLAAPRIAETVPETEPALARYVEAVDDLRVTLDRGADRAVATVSSLLPPDG